MVSSVNWNGNSENLANFIESNLSTADGRERAAREAGKAMDKYEDLLVKAASVDGDNQAEVNKLAQEAGLDTSSQGKNWSLEGIQMALKTRYERAQRSFAMLQELISSAHQLMMRLINSIGRN